MSAIELDRPTGAIALGELLCGADREMTGWVSGRLRDGQVGVSPSHRVEEPVVT